MAEKKMATKKTAEVKSKEVKKTTEKVENIPKKIESKVTKPVEPKVENLPKPIEVPVKNPKVETKQKPAGFEKQPSAGKQIRTLFELVIPKLKDEQLEILTSAEKTKEVLKIRYPFLKEVKNEKDERKVNGHARYNKTIVKINDKDYYVTNDLYSKQVPIFEEWIKSIK